VDQSVKIDFKKLPLFKDIDPSKWQLIYLAKLKACRDHIADFTDSKKDVDLKDLKKECLIEMIDLIDTYEAADYILNEQVLSESMKTIAANLFRTFANKNNRKSSSVDPDEDEPNLEEAWPHIQLVYELLLKFIMSPHLSGEVVTSHIANSFIKQFVELFDSEDPRERDYLKTILHRIYGKYMRLRPYIKE
jgi:serine/threonine-protein phosphatase 2A regulatory subunit B'